jgi:signal transduction histidine kinase
VVAGVSASTGGERAAFRPSWVDVVPAVLLVWIGVFGSGPAARHQHTTVTPLAYGLIVLAALAALLWRIRPLWALGVVTGSIVAYLLLGYPDGPIVFSQAVVVFGAALWLPLRRLLPAIGIVLVASAAVAALGVVAGHRAWADLVPLVVCVVIPAAIGVAIKARRDAAKDVRAAQAKRAVSEERLRLAQEVHDVAGHGFAVIAMQAGVALRVLDRDPAAARGALEGIRSASREALDGLRAEIEALRSDAPLRPRSGLADLPALADRMRASGLPVDLLLPGDADIAEPVDLAAYRIVQESLTNVLRHAGPLATARVSVTVEGRRLRVEVRDDGHGTPTPELHPGRGIDGMRERAAALGGTLTAGPAAAGGFAVTAELPLSTADSTA